jgi:hypothetical protein
MREKGLEKENTGINVKDSHVTNSALGDAVVDGWGHGWTDRLEHEVEGGAQQLLHVSSCGHGALHRAVGERGFCNCGNLGKALKEQPSLHVSRSVPTKRFLLTSHFFALLWRCSHTPLSHHCRFQVKNCGSQQTKCETHIPLVLSPGAVFPPPKMAQRSRGALRWLTVCAGRCIMSSSASLLHETDDKSAAASATSR